jgi:hypothetical protein
MHFFDTTMAAVKLNTAEILVFTGDEIQRKPAKLSLENNNLRKSQTSAGTGLVR